MVRFFANKCGVEIRGEAVPPERAGRLGSKLNQIVGLGRIAGLHGSLGKARFCPLCCHCKPSFKKAGARALRRPRLAVRLRQLDRAQEPPRNISMLKDRDG
jgi:hypothetical protein